MRNFLPVEKKMKKQGLTLQENDEVTLQCSVLKMCCWKVVEYFLKDDLIKYRLKERIR